MRHIFKQTGTFLVAALVLILGATVASQPPRVGSTGQRAGGVTIIPGQYVSGTGVARGALLPPSNDGAALGVSGTAWSDLFLASGGVINWSAGDVTLTHSADTLALAGGVFRLEATTTSTTGVITKGANRFIHNFQHPTGGGAVPVGLNTFVGELAGNFTTGSTATETYHSSALTAVGYQALQANTTGYYNTASGYQALYTNSTGSSNTASGTQALYTNSTGSSNTASGYAALNANSTGSYNTANGYLALYTNSTGAYNTASGTRALYNLTGNYSENTALGVNSGRYYGSGTSALTQATQSVFLGAEASASANTQTNEIVIGYNAIGAGSNKAVLGASTITDVYFGSATGAANAHAAAYYIGASTAGCSGVPSTSTNGIVTTCTGPEASPDALLAYIASLEQRLAMLEAQMSGRQ